MERRVQLGAAAAHVAVRPAARLRRRGRATVRSCCPGCGRSPGRPGRTGSRRGNSRRRLAPQPQSENRPEPGALLEQRQRLACPSDPDGRPSVGYAGSGRGSRRHPALPPLGRPQRLTDHRDQRQRRQRSQQPPPKPRPVLTSTSAVPAAEQKGRASSPPTPAPTASVDHQLPAGRGDQSPRVARRPASRPRDSPATTSP